MINCLIRSSNDKIVVKIKKKKIVKQAQKLYFDYIISKPSLDRDLSFNYKRKQQKLQATT